MKNFLKLLISKLNTIDGTRNTASNIKNDLFNQMIQNERATDFWEKTKIRQKVSRKIIEFTFRGSRKYLILKIRQKISFLAFMNKKTVGELIAR